MGHLVEGELHLRGQLGARLREALFDRGEVEEPPVLVPAERLPPRRRVCDEAYLLLRSLFHPEEDAVGFIVERDGYLALPDDERDRMIQEALMKGRWNFVALRPARCERFMTRKTLHVARTSDGLDHVNTLDLRLEDRHVFLLEGLQFHNNQLPASLQVPETLVNPKTSFGTVKSKKALAVQITDANNWEYESLEQGVRYRVQRLFTRDEFKKALETPDAHVLYSGHARFGRGPCFGFGDGKSTGEKWEDGDDDATGILRMGKPFLAIPVSDLLHHQVHGQPRDRGCHHHRSRLRRRLEAARPRRSRPRSPRTSTPASCPS